MLSFGIWNLESFGDLFRDRVRFSDSFNNSSFSDYFLLYFRFYFSLEGVCLSAESGRTI